MEGRKVDLSGMYRAYSEANPNASIEWPCPIEVQGLSLPWVLSNGVVYWNGIPQGPAAADGDRPANLKTVIEWPCGVLERDHAAPVADSFHEHR